MFVIDDNTSLQGNLSFSQNQIYFTWTIYGTSQLAKYYENSKVIMFVIISWNDTNFIVEDFYSEILNNKNLQQIATLNQLEILDSLMFSTFCYCLKKLKQRRKEIFIYRKSINQSNNLILKQMGFKDKNNTKEIFYGNVVEIFNICNENIKKDGIIITDNIVKFKEYKITSNEVIIDWITSKLTDICYCTGQFCKYLLFTNKIKYTPKMNITLPLDIIEYIIQDIFKCNIIKDIKTDEAFPEDFHILSMKLLKEHLPENTLIPSNIIEYLWKYISFGVANLKENTTSSDDILKKIDQYQTYILEQKCPNVNFNDLQGCLFQSLIYLTLKIQDWTDDIVINNNEILYAFKILLPYEVDISIPTPELNDDDAMKFKTLFVKEIKNNNFKISLSGYNSLDIVLNMFRYLTITLKHNTVLHKKYINRLKYFSQSI